MNIPFTKMHGIGNDYVYVDCFENEISDPSALALAVSPRRTSIGSDGMIMICPSEVADCRMEMYNLDGSRGEMCGNGIRCVARYAWEQGLTRNNPMRVETDAGIKEIELRIDAGRVSAVTVDMGAPILEAAEIPVSGSGRIVSEPIEVEGRAYRMTCVSMGNPHAVVFVDDIEALDLERIGSLFEKHERFPNRINTEFVRVEGPDSLHMRVWERGSGETRACGTGACAVLVAASLTERAGRRATVHLTGGDLEIEWREDDHILMTGPAEEVFRGVFPFGPSPSN